MPNNWVHPQFCYALRENKVSKTPPPWAPWLVSKPSQDPMLAQGLSQVKRKEAWVPGCLIAMFHFIKTVKVFIKCWSFRGQ